jgi:hypothetical protein
VIHAIQRLAIIQYHCICCIALVKGIKARARLRTGRRDVPPAPGLDPLRLLPDRVTWHNQLRGWTGRGRCPLLPLSSRSCGYGGRRFRGGTSSVLFEDCSWRSELSQFIYHPVWDKQVQSIEVGFNTRYVPSSPHCWLFE